MAAEAPLRETIRGVPVLGLAASSGGGKTTLLAHLIPRLRMEGLRVGCIKHSHHAFEVDQPGKDSHRLRTAGASQIVLSGRGRWVLTTEHDDDAPLEALLEAMNLDVLDLVLVEGFRDAPIPRIGIHRAAPLAMPPETSEAGVIALVSDTTRLPNAAVPVFAPDDVHSIATFVLAHVRRLHLRPGRATA